MTLRIPHSELVPELDEYEEIDIVITLETKWEQTEDGKANLTSEFTESK